MPNPDDPERLFHFYVDGSVHGPYPGLVRERETLGHAGPYCSPVFTRPVAERIVEDLHLDNCGLTGRWEDNRLTFEWGADYDGDGGAETVEPDSRGLYKIGGRWPWDYDGPLDAAERHQAALARPSRKAAATNKQATAAVALVGAGPTPGPAAGR
ncbi:hypothetical protein [Kitasatospora sp. NPDC127116]|uniref:hypothetical protein n=1 Tax=Kitasatospora sp. NPDC127116 TaxID=3345367 RepID=UPI003634A663